MVSRSEATNMSYVTEKISIISGPQLCYVVCSGTICLTFSRSTMFLRDQSRLNYFELNFSLLWCQVSLCFFNPHGWCSSRAFFLICPLACLLCSLLYSCVSCLLSCFIAGFNSFFFACLFACLPLSRLDGPGLGCQMLQGAWGSCCPLLDALARLCSGLADQSLGVR